MGVCVSLYTKSFNKILSKTAFGQKCLAECFSSFNDLGCVRVSLYVCMHAGVCMIGLLHVLFLTVNKDQDSNLPIIQTLCTVECAVVVFYRRVLMMICRY